MFRFAKHFLTELGVEAGDVIHILTTGEHLDILFAIYGCWFIGAVPAFGESQLSEEALVDQVTFLLAFICP